MRDPARRTSQLYLRVAWTSAFKEFFLFRNFCILVRRGNHMAMVGIKIEQSNICGLIATDQSFHTRFYYNLLYWVKHTDYYTY